MASFCPSLDNFICICFLSVRRQVSKGSSKRNSNDSQSTSRLPSATGDPEGSYGQKLACNQSNLPLDRRDDQMPISNSNKYCNNSQRKRYHADNNATSSQVLDRSLVSVENKTEDSRQNVGKEDPDCYFDIGVNRTTDIFCAIIDPSSHSHHLRQQSSLRGGTMRPIPKGTERSKLKLKGLQTHTKKSFEEESLHGSHSRWNRHVRSGTTAAVEVHHGRFHDLSPEVEIDGPDFAGMYLSVIYYLLVAKTPAPWKHLGLWLVLQQFPSCHNGKLLKP